MSVISTGIISGGKSCGGNSNIPPETYKGDYNAFANTPDLKKTGTIVSTATVGDFYIVTVAGTQDLGGGSKEYGKGDKAKFNGSFFDKEDVVIPDGNQIVLDKTDSASPTVTQAINSKASSTNLTQEVQNRINADAGLQTEINGKANLVSGAVANHLLITNANGQPQNSGYSISETLDATTDNIPTSKAIDKGVATDVVTIKPSEGIGNNKTAPLYFSGMDNSQFFVSYLSNLSGSNNKVYFGVKKASNPNVDALVLDLTPKKALLFGSYIATITNLVLRYDNNNFPYYTNQILVDQSTGDRAIVKQNFTSSTSTTFQDLINSNKIAIIPLGSRTPYPTLDNPDQNPLYNNANGFSVDSEIEYNGQVWVYISENAEGIPSWVIKEDVVNVSRSFGLVGEYANGTIIIVSNAIGMPNADYSANPIPANLFAKSFKANYIINDSQPVFDILDSNGNLVNQLPLEYLSSSENPIKNDDDLLLSNHNLGCTNQGDLNDALTSAISNKADKVANATAGHLASLDVNGNLADSGITASNVTTQGNSFNGENQLVKLNGSGKVPASTIPTILTDLAEPGNNISLTLNSLTGKYTIASTGGNPGTEDQGLKVVSVNGNDTTGNGTYDNPYKNINKALSVVKWNSTILSQPSSGGLTHNMSQIIVPEDSSNPSVIHWNITLKGDEGATNANRTEFTFDNTTINFISLPATNVRLNFVDLNLNFNANPTKPLIFGGGGGNVFENITLAKHTTPLTFDFTNWKNTSNFLYLRDLSLNAFAGNLKFKNIPVGISNITVYIQGGNSTNLSLDTLEIATLNPTATLTIIVDNNIIFGENAGLISPNAIILTNEVKDFIGFIATSGEFLTRNISGLYILSANIISVGSRGDVVYIIKTGLNTSILGGRVRTYAQCPNDFLNVLTGVTYFKEAGYWSTKENTITAGTTAQYYRGDKTFQTLNSTAVGLANVNNTSDANKPISIATQTALDSKASITEVTKKLENTVATFVEQSTTPLVPNAGKLSFYAKTDDKLYYLNSAGAEVEVGTANGASGELEPIGTVKAYYGKIAPQGYLICDGANYSKDIYASLWAFAVSESLTTTNTANKGLFFDSGASTFKVPDLRGYFLRGLGGVDPTVGRAMGSVQADDFKSHGHVYISGRTFPGVEAGSGGYSWARYENDTSTTSNVGGAETRPVNIAVNYIIKAQVIGGASIVGGLTYKGSWDASTNTPTLPNVSDQNGFYYKVSVKGNTNINGITSWDVGDWIVFNGTNYDQIANYEAVNSVNGKLGNVVVTATDVGLGNVTNDSQLKRSSDFKTFEKKTDISANDIFLIEDSEASDVKKYGTIQGVLNLISSTGDVQYNAIDNTLTTPPSASDGDRYLIPATGATGAWLNQGNKIATWSSGAWSFLTPTLNMVVVITGGSNVGLSYAWNGTSWATYQASGVPTGTLLISSLKTVPAGYVDVSTSRQTLSKVTFSKLWNVAVSDGLTTTSSSEYGRYLDLSPGNNSGNFQTIYVGDWFPRFAGPSRQQGTWQGDQLRWHQHGYADYYAAGGVGWAAIQT